MAFLPQWDDRCQQRMLLIFQFVLCQRKRTLWLRALHTYFGTFSTQRILSTVSRCHACEMASNEFLFLLSMLRAPTYCCCFCCCCCRSSWLNSVLFSSVPVCAIASGIFHSFNLFRFCHFRFGTKTTSATTTKDLSRYCRWCGVFSRFFNAHFVVAISLRF